MEILDQKLFFDKANYQIKKKSFYFLLLSVKYFRWIRTGQTGKDILFKLDGTKTVNEVIKDISSEYEIPEEIVREDVIDFCQKAQKKELLCSSKDDIKQPEIDSNIRHLSIDVTNYCNKKCKYCNIKICNNKSRAKFVSLATIKDYFVQLFPTGKCPNTSIYLTGGEPLAHKCILELIEFIKQYEAQIILWTNGSLLDSSMAQELSKNKIVVFLSIDSANEEINDRARGKGSYSEAIKASKICERFKLEYMYCVTVSKFNIDKLEDIISLIQDNSARGIFINIQIVFNEDGESLQHYFDYTHSYYWEKILGFSKKVHIINSWRNRNSETKTVLKIIREDSLCLNSINYIQAKSNCGAGINKLSIDVSGNIFPCKTLQSKGYSFGNISEYITKKKELKLPATLKKFDLCKKCDVELFCLGGCKAEIISQTGKINELSNDYCKNRRLIIKKQLWAPVILTKIDSLAEDE